MTPANSLAAKLLDLLNSVRFTRHQISQWDSHPLSQPYLGSSCHGKTKTNMPTSAPDHHLFHLIPSGPSSFLLLYPRWPSVLSCSLVHPSITCLIISHPFLSNLVSIKHLFNSFCQKAQLTWTPSRPPLAAEESCRKAYGVSDDATTSLSSPIATESWTTLTSIPFPDHLSLPFPCSSYSKTSPLFTVHNLTLVYLTLQINQHFISPRK